MSTTSLILSSSSGQMSGQFVKPKYMSVHCPSRLASVNVDPSCAYSENGPPIRGLPVLTDFCAAALPVNINDQKDGEEV